MSPDQLAAIEARLSQVTGRREAVLSLVSATAEQREQLSDAMCLSIDHYEADIAALLVEVGRLRTAIADATEFTLNRDSAYEAGRLPTKVAWRGPGDAWAVTDGAFVLNAVGEREYEPIPSSRDEAFKARTRFPLDDAMARAWAVLGEDPA